MRSEQRFSFHEIRSNKIISALKILLGALKQADTALSCFSFTNAPFKVVN